MSNTLLPPFSLPPSFKWLATPLPPESCDTGPFGGLYEPATGKLLDIATTAAILHPHHKIVSPGDVVARCLVDGIPLGGVQTSMYHSMSGGLVVILNGTAVLGASGQGVNKWLYFILFFHKHLDYFLIFYFIILLFLCSVRNSNTEYELQHCVRHHCRASSELFATIYVA